MAVSYLRPASSPERAAQRRHRRLTAPPRRMRPRYFVFAGLLAVLVAAGVGALMLVSAHASLSVDGAALAKVNMPLGGGKIEVVTVTGPHGRPIPVAVRNDPTIWPKQAIPAHTHVSITVVIKRPGWVSWLAGKTETLHLSMTTPSASLVHHYLTVGPGQALALRFKQPISTILVRAGGSLRKHTLAHPQSTVNVDHSTPAGTLEVRAALRSWESAKPAVISWFPPGGAGASAVASPAPGAQISPDSPLMLTFSKPVSKALNGTKARDHARHARDLGDAQQPHDPVPAIRLRLRSGLLGLGRAPERHQACRRPAEWLRDDRTLDGPPPARRCDSRSCCRSPGTCRSPSITPARACR